MPYKKGKVTKQKKVMRSAAFNCEICASVITAYIARTLLEPETALSLVGRIEDAILSLETLPSGNSFRITLLYIG